MALPRNSLPDWQFAFYCVIAFLGFSDITIYAIVYVSSFSFNDENLIVELPNSKTDQFRARSTFYFAANTVDASICPVAVAKAYFVQLNNRLQRRSSRPSGPKFPGQAYITRGSSEASAGRTSGHGQQPVAQRRACLSLRRGHSSGRCQGLQGVDSDPRSVAVRTRQ